MTSETTPLGQSNAETQEQLTPTEPIAAPMAPPAVPPVVGTQKANTTTTSGFLAALIIQKNALGSIWKGDTVQAFRLAAATKHFWLLTFALMSVAIGVTTATLVARSVDATDGFIDSLSSGLIGYSSRGMIGMSFGQWFALFCAGLVLVFVAMTLRTLCVKWTFSLRGASQSFNASASIVAVAYVVPLAVALASMVVFFIPSMIITGIWGFLLMVAAVPLALISEVLIYVGLNRTVKFHKSALIPHAIFTGLCGVMVSIAYFILFIVFLESLS